MYLQISAHQLIRGVCTETETLLNIHFDSADVISNLDIDLQNNSSWKGAINTDNSAASTSLTLDTSSNWTVTADWPACPELGGHTYTFSIVSTLPPLE
jgi:hypothetical protein